MKLGSPKHKAQYCGELIKSYYENIWNDEIYRSRKQLEQEYWEKELTGLKVKLERKEFKKWNEDKGMFEETPLHDFTSHAADIDGYAAIIEDQMTNENDLPLPEQEEPNSDVYDE